MARTIELTYDNCEFETADGLILGGPYLSVEIETDGESFTVESVRNQGFPTLGKPSGPAAAYVCDFIKQWVVDDLAKGDASLLRERYADELRDEAEREAGDWADYRRQQARDDRAHMGRAA